MQFSKHIFNLSCAIQCFNQKRFKLFANISNVKFIFSILFLFLSVSLHSQNISGFIENKGQFYDQLGKDVDAIKYLHKSGLGLSTQFLKDGFSYELQSREKKSKKHPLATDLLLIHRVDVKFKRLNPYCEIISKGETETSLNYYLRGKHIEGVNTFDELIYKNVWPNIDLKFKSGDLKTGIKYEFILHEGAKIEDIQFEILGANGIEIPKKHLDELKIKTSLGVITDKIPYSFEIEGQSEIKRFAKWKMVSENTVGVDIDAWNHKNKLVIDPQPILIWGTYYGGVNKDEGKATDIDSNGNPIFLGVTSSTGLTTTGAHQTVLRANDDIYLLKMNKNGGTGSKIWCTYFGSDSIESAGAVTVDKMQNVIICGTTRGDTFIAYKSKNQTKRAGSEDAFITKFRSNGRIGWSTYLGDIDHEEALSIKAQDTFIYVVGLSQKPASSANAKPTNIATSGAISSGAKAVQVNKTDAFYVKLDSAGRRRFGIFIGGKEDENYSSVFVNKQGEVFLYGTTASDTGINIKASSTKSNGTDVYITRFSKNNKLIWSKYLGGNSDDLSSEIVVDKDTSIYISGTTKSNNISTTGAHQAIFNLNATNTTYDAFLSKLRFNGNVAWTTYYGGTVNEAGNGLAIDDFDYVYMVGVTNSENIYKASKTSPTLNNIIATDSAFQKDYVGGDDGFLVKFDTTGRRIWSTYLGGKNNEELKDVANGKNGDVFVIGTTATDNGIISFSNQWVPLKNALQDTFGGSLDAYLARLNYCKKFLAIKMDTVCVFDSLQLRLTNDSNKITGRNNYKLNWNLVFPKTYNVNWTGPNGFNSKFQNPKRKMTFADTGLYVAVVTNEFGCRDTGRIRVRKLNSLPTVAVTSSNKYCRGDVINLTATASKGKTYTWTGNNFTATGKSVQRKFAYAGSTDGKYKVNVLDSNGCKGSDSIVITVGPEGKISSNSPVCPGDTIRFYNSIKNLKSIKWAGPNNTTVFSTASTPKIGNANASKTGVYTAYIEDNSGCKDTQSINVTLQTWSNLTIQYDTSICAGATWNVNVTISGGVSGYSFYWTGPNSYVNGNDSI